MKLEDILKGSWVDKKISKIRAMTVEQLQSEVNKNLGELSKRDRLAFVFVLKKEWEEIVETYGSLVNKGYEELRKLREPLDTLGDLSGSDVHELDVITIVNEQFYKDSKVEIYLIGRLTNTRLISKLMDRMHLIFGVQ